MNIIYARMINYDNISVPSDAVAREMELLGHKVIIAEGIDQVPLGHYDFVWSPYESVTLMGKTIADRLKLPHFSHIEVLPPWRVLRNIDYENYGLSSNDPEISEANLRQTIPYYIETGRAWANAEIKTISNHCRIEFHHKLLGQVPNLQLRYPSIDVRTFETAKKMYSPKRIYNGVITISRATAIKRYDLLLEVMNQVQSKVVWTIIGHGPMIKIIQKNLKNPNVKLRLLGPLWGWQRIYELMKHKVMVYAMGGMPPLEAALLNIFPIVIENPPTKHLPEFDKFMEYNFGNSLPIFKYNQTTEMAKLVDEEINKPIGGSLQKWDTVDKFMSGKTNVTPSSVNAKQVIERMETWLKKS